MWAALRDDERALTISFVELLASLAVGTVIIWVIYETTAKMLTDARAEAPGGMGGLLMNDWFTIGNEVIPGIFLIAAFFGFIVRAVYERRGA